MGREVDISQMPLEQLNHLKTKHEEECKELQQRIRTVGIAEAKILGAISQLEQLPAKEGAALLVPLSESLHCRTPDENRCLCLDSSSPISST